MKHLSDDELSKELKQLGKAFAPSSEQRENVQRLLFHPSRSNRTFRQRSLLPSIVSLIVLCSVCAGLYVGYSGSSLNGIKYSTRMYMDQAGTITDKVTPRRLESAQQTEHTFLIDWGSDAMDSGDHDFDTFYHGQLVVSPDTSNLERGQAVYYHMPPSVTAKNPAIPEKYIGRVVGLPGEMVEIKNGQVYIDGKRLDAFYGKATRRGMGEDDYFANTPRNAIADEQSTREYFNMNLAPVTVPDNSVYLLVDQWWRGLDSRDFGSLPIQEIEGVIIGYEE
ncbi:signal peptidase I [Sporosarcina luteola]|nr:signal peptidase I [Sporosarcina luteola]